MSRINCMYGVTKDLKLVKVKRFLKTDSFEIYIPNGVDGISRHYKSNELSAHLTYVSTSYEKALAMQKKLRKQKEKQPFIRFCEDRIELGHLPTYPENPFNNYDTDADAILNEHGLWLHQKVVSEIKKIEYKKGFEDAKQGLKIRDSEYHKYIKAYKKVCEKLAEKTIAPKEYWEKWGFDE